MINEIEKTIRSLKVSLRELNKIEMGDYVLESGCQVQGVGKLFSEYHNEAQFQLEVILNDLEEKYQKLHKAGAYNE